MGWNRSSFQIDQSLNELSGTTEFLLKRLLKLRLSLCQSMLLVFYATALLWFSLQASPIQQSKAGLSEVEVPLGLVGIGLMIPVVSTFPLILTGLWLNQKAKRRAIVPLLVVIGVGYGQLVLGTHLPYLGLLTIVASILLSLMVLLKLPTAPHIPSMTVFALLAVHSFVLIGSGVLGNVWPWEWSD